jgi:hypothetical protein
MTDKWDGTGSGYEAVLEARERAERQIVERNRSWQTYV